MDIKHRNVVARGVRHHVAEIGDGSPIVFLHGWPEFWACWLPIFERLHEKFRLIAIDFRGFGESENPNPEPTDIVNAQFLAEDVIAVLEQMGIAQAGLVGHDVGALVMQEIVKSQPKLVRGLFFFNCLTPGIGARWNAPSHVNEIWYQTFHQMPFAAEVIGNSEETCRAYFKYFLNHWSYREGVFDAVLDQWVENFMRPGNLQGGFNWYRGQNKSRLAVMMGTLPKPAKIDVPTRVLWGRHDPIIKSEWSDVLGDYFSNYTLGFAEDAGHFVHYEMPDLASSDIERFFASLQGAS